MASRQINLDLLIYPSMLFNSFPSYRAMTNPPGLTVRLHISLSLPNQINILTAVTATL